MCLITRRTIGVNVERILPTKAALASASKSVTYSPLRCSGYVEIGSSMGRSVGLVPLKTLSMFTAARLYVSHRLAPYERRGTHLYEFLVARYHR